MPMPQDYTILMNQLPVVGWFLSFLGSVSMAVPFWLCWTVFGLGTTYFGFLPPVWQTIPFWHCVGLFLIASVARTTFRPKQVAVVK